MNTAPAQIARTAFRLIAKHRDICLERVFYKSNILVGRLSQGAERLDFEFSQDPNISRMHLRIVAHGNQCQIEDLGSKFGTKVDGKEIRGLGAVAVSVTSVIQIGETHLKIEGPFESASGFAELLSQNDATTTFEIGTTISQRELREGVASSTRTTNETFLGLAEAVARFASLASLDQLLKTIIGEVVGLVSGAQRGTLLLRNPATDGLLVAAFVSPGEPSVSETLARRALGSQDAFVWQDKYESDPSLSIRRHRIKSGVYAQLSYECRTFGVICVDNPDCSSAFSREELKVVMAAARHAGLAVKAFIDRDLDTSRVHPQNLPRGAQPEDAGALLRLNCVRAALLLPTASKLGV